MAELETPLPHFEHAVFVSLKQLSIGSAVVLRSRLVVQHLVVASVAC